MPPPPLPKRILEPELVALSTHLKAYSIVLALISTNISTECNGEDWIDIRVQCRYSTTVRDCAGRCSQTC